MHTLLILYKDRHMHTKVYTHTHTGVMQGRSEAMQDARRQLLCVWQSDTGFGASPAFWYYIVCSGATQRGLLQVWRLWMFQLSEFPDKLVSGTQWRVSFIRVQFNFTLSYITLSPRGRISHPILHFESESELCPQTTQLVSSSFSFFPPSPCLLTVFLHGLWK